MAPFSGLVINTLPYNDETDDSVHAWLRRNDLDVGLLRGLQCEVIAQFGLQRADRNDRFAGMTFALLDITVTPGMSLPASLGKGLEFAPSLCTLASGESFHMRHIAVWPGPLEPESSFPPTREGWPLPFRAALACFDDDQRSVVLFMMGRAVIHKCRILDTIPSTSNALKAHKRPWRKLQALLQTMDVSSRGCPTTFSTKLLPLEWANPEDLPRTDSCVAHTSPGVWMNQCCADGGIWNTRPDLEVPAGIWVPAVLHILKARVLASIAAQRAVSPHRMLRGHINPKMPNVFWVSCSAITVEDPQGASGHAETWRP
jgi:hypothetical protein